MRDKQINVAHLHPVAFKHGQTLRRHAAHRLPENFSPLHGQKKVIGQSIPFLHFHGGTAAHDDKIVH